MSFKEKGNLEAETYRGEGHVERETDWGDDSTSQGTPRTAGHHQKLGERHVTGSSLEPQRDHDSAITRTGGPLAFRTVRE